MHDLPLQDDPPLGTNAICLKANSEAKGLSASLARWQRSNDQVS